MIPHLTLVAMLAADRANNAVGDAGGFVARADTEPSLVGHTDEKREHCPVHGWVGRLAFERDGHEHCEVAPEVESPWRPTDNSEHISADDPQGRINRKRKRPRARTIAVKRITREDLRIGALLYPVIDVERPRTRGECGDERPCPFVGCSHHLYLDVNVETGAIKLNFPDLEPWDMKHSCTLDEADKGAHTLEAVGERINVTRERLRQIEVEATEVLRQALVREGLAEDNAPPRAAEGA